jgi:hypothetical protein
MCRPCTIWSGRSLIRPVPFRLKILNSVLDPISRSFQSDPARFFAEARGREYTRSASCNWPEEVRRWKRILPAHFRRRYPTAACLFSGTCESCRAACVRAVTTRDLRPDFLRTSCVPLVDDTNLLCFTSCWVGAGERLLVKNASTIGTRTARKSREVSSSDSNINIDQKLHRTLMQHARRGRNIASLTDNPPLDNCF